MDSRTWSRRLPSSPGGICPSLTSAILCVLQGPTCNPLRASASQVKRGWFSSSWHCEPGRLSNPGNQRTHQQTHCSFFLENILKASLLPTCQASPGLGSAQVSCCSSAHQLFHRVTQIPCVASARPLRPCAARRQTLPGACEFEYSWLAGSQGLSCSALRSVRGALKGRIVTCAERSRHGVSNYSSFQTTASCFGLLEQ